MEHCLEREWAQWVNHDGSIWRPISPCLSWFDDGDGGNGEIDDDDIGDSDDYDDDDNGIDDNNVFVCMRDDIGDHVDDHGDAVGDDYT